ncbi:hypothetical protein [Methylibium petroleiphilum]|uniref:Putative transmembrane protein n=1 Tax=Methylibium petroleiphilum (strain ATCC BAA-1232 / LMG 22953 / PM1) TaxID=420662 RepID=A2SIN8_METPP|nr:hypothetical protein [Methylibium petroleiphilum]ABM95427.1 putative transmembrane protein [Methylibium petroleiphilum PM1]
MRQRTLWIVWPSFLMAGVLEVLVFSAADPAELSGWVGRALETVSPAGVYTLAFFAFWTVCALTSMLTLLLAMPEPANTEPRRWP